MNKLTSANSYYAIMDVLNAEDWIIRQEKNAQSATLMINRLFISSIKSYTNIVQYRPKFKA